MTWKFCVSLKYCFLYRLGKKIHFLISDPPSTPEISGKAQVSLGFAQKLTCTSQAGYPPAKLSWFRGSAMMESHYSVEGDVVKAEVISVLSNFRPLKMV